ncbi:IgGFc-binding protein [Dysgonomonas reticulitermitis]
MNIKQNKYLLFLALCLLAMAQLSHAQSNTSKGAEGTDFYLSFGHNGGTTAPTIQSIALQIKIISPQASKVEFVYKNAPSLNKTYDLAAGVVTNIELTTSEKEAVYTKSTSLTPVSNRSFRIKSDHPIIVYALNAVRLSTDATNVLPVQYLGTDYYHISYKPSYYDGYTIVATEDGTDIYENNTKKATNLQQGQIYNHYVYPDDETGKHITSNKPVAFFSTPTGMQIPTGTPYADLIFQQLPPVNSWGKTFLVPVTSQGTERVRIVGTQDGTSLTVSGGTPVPSPTPLTLNAGKFIELEIKSASKGCYITASKPVGICSYLTGRNGQSDGDPSMAWIAPLEQMIGSVTVAPFVPKLGSTYITKHYVMVVTLTSTKANTRMSKNGGSPASLSGGTWTDNSGSKYSYYTLPLDQDIKTYYTFSNTTGLFVMGYGLGQQESYYYLAGSALKSLAAAPAFKVNGEHYQDVYGRSFDGCTDNPIRFEAILETGYTGYIKWYINEVEETGAKDRKQWNKDLGAGTYTVRMEIQDKVTQTRSLSTTFTVTKCASQRILLPVNPGSFFQ